MPAPAPGVDSRNSTGSWPAGRPTSFDLARREVIQVAPDPGLAIFDGANQRVAGGMEMPGGMLVLRGVAAADMAALQAEPQVNPAIACLDAVLANVFRRLANPDLIQMFA